MAGRAGKRPRGSGRARGATPVLGNDPFERGAALRGPEAAPVTPPAAERAPSPSPPLADGAPSTVPPPAGCAPSASPPPAEGKQSIPDRESPSPSPRSGGGEGPGEGAAAGSPGDTDYARELAELAAGLLPALKDRLRGLAGLLRLGEAAAPLDPHGMDPTLLPRAAALLDFLYLTFWRVEASTAAALPEGPLVVVANHGGAVPWDALVLRLAVRRETPSHRDLRPLLDAGTLARPFVGRAAARFGAVPASPGNALALLGQDTAIGVFPGGGEPRRWSERYRIGAFGRGGFVKVALRAGAAIVPCAIVGSEEASPPLGRSGFLADAFRLPLLAAIPGIPVGPFDGLPLPSRWTLRFGAPVDLDGLGPEAAGDPGAVARLTARTRERLQVLLDESVAARRSVFL